MRRRQSIAVQRFGEWRNGRRAETNPLGVWDRRCVSQSISRAAKANVVPIPSAANGVRITGYETHAEPLRIDLFASGNVRSVFAQRSSVVGCVSPDDPYDERRWNLFDLLATADPEHSSFDIERWRELPLTCAQLPVAPLELTEVVCNSGSSQTKTRNTSQSATAMDAVETMSQRVPGPSTPAATPRVADPGTTILPMMNTDSEAITNCLAAAAGRARANAGTCGRCGAPKAKASSSARSHRRAIGSAPSCTSSAHMSRVMRRAIRSRSAAASTASSCSTTARGGGSSPCSGIASVRTIQFRRKYLPAERKL